MEINNAEHGARSSEEGCFNKNTFFRILRSAFRAAFWFLFPLSVWANGLSTSFFDVKVQDVAIGKPYDVTAQTGKRLDFQNLGDQVLTLQIQALRPTSEQLRSSAEPIPDPSWIRITPSQLELSPRGTGYADIVIEVPQGQTRRAKTYQVMIWSRGRAVDSKGGVIMSPALLSRLRFTLRP